jgi:rRNA maturation endonuclease Nob1
MARELNVKKSRARSTGKTAVATWRVDLRCYNCNALFTLREVPGNQLAGIADLVSCPKCGSASDRPMTFGSPRQHLIIKLTIEEDFVL